MLSIKNLTANFALQSLNLEIAKGHFVSLIGANGAGKSTLLHCIAGLAEPQEGILEFENKPILPPSARLVSGHPHIEMLTQQPNLFLNFTVSENIGYYLRPLEAAEKANRLAVLMDLVQVSHLATRLPRELSGGEAQRVGLAKALAKKPQLLLLDEPFSQADSVLRMRLLSQLKDFQKQDELTLLMVAHQSAEVLAFSDLVAVLENGQITQYESPTNVFFKPRNSYIAQLLGEISELEGVFYRPSEIQICALEQANCRKAKVLASIFVGNNWRIEAQLETGEKVWTQQSAAFEPLAKGLQIGLLFKKLV